MPQAGAAAGLHAGGAFGEGGGAAGAEQGTGDDGGAVGQQGTAEALLGTRQFEQAGSPDHAIQGAGGIEYFHQDEHEHDLQQHRDGGAAVMVEQAGQVQLQEGRGQAGRQGNHAVVLHFAEQPGCAGDGEDADQDGTTHAPRFEDGDQQEAGQGEQRRGGIERPECNQGVGVGDDDAGFLQGDDGEEQTDTGHNRGTQRGGDAGHQPGTHAGQRQCEEHQSRDEHGGQRLLPRQSGGADHGEGEERIQAHARCHAHGEVGSEGHHQRAQCGGQAGGDEHGARVHAGGGKDVGVDEDDVGHRQERGQPGQHFGPHGGAVLLELEQAFKQVHGGDPWGGVLWRKPRPSSDASLAEGRRARGYGTRREPIHGGS
jgi:hypothetical protein